MKKRLTFALLSALMLASASSQAQWKTPVEMWREQIEAFAKLYPHDVRAVQPLNGRMVKESR